MYRIFSRFISPFMPLVLALRRLRGKEDALRMEERLGTAGMQRPAGPLVWVHAASVGESNSVLALMERLLTQYPDIHLLLTTITVTSAELIKHRLPARAFHQFAPVDTPQAVEAFLTHWRPDTALWVESELWPNLITQTRSTGCRMALLNARMSERSFSRWQRMPKLIASMLRSFEHVFAQSEVDAMRFTALGAPNVQYLGNLKYDTAPLPAPAQEVKELSTLFGSRPVWLMASLHPGEESVAAEVHSALKREHPGLLTVLVPRHSARAEEMAHFLRNRHFTLVQRSRQEKPDARTDFYLADTMGELGLFYSCIKLVCMGGSFIPHGGQNPLEPAQMGCAVLVGPHMQNFAQICEELIHAGALLQVTHAQNLADALRNLLLHPEQQKTLARQAAALLQQNQGVQARILAALEPLLALRLASAPQRKEA